MPRYTEHDPAVVPVQMEFLIVLCTIISASMSQPVVKTWTLNELSTAIELHTDEFMEPYFEDALNQIMYTLFTGSNEDVHAILPSPTGDRTWTMKQLEKAVDDPGTNPNYQTFISGALHQLHYMQDAGKKLDSIEVVVPALDISVWTSSDIQAAKNDPSTKPELLQLLKKAEDEIQEAINRGEKKEKAKAVLVTSVGLVPLKTGTAPVIIPKKH